MKSDNNVTSFLEFKHQKEECVYHSSLKEYFGVLNFQELIAESSEILSELSNNPFNLELSMRSTLILKEFHSRIRDSKNMSAKLEEKLENITKKTQIIRQNLSEQKK